MSEMAELAMHKEILNKLEGQKMNQVAVQNFTQEKIDLIKNTVAPKDATNIELQLFIEQCKRTGLDPITRQIYFMKNDGRVQIQVSIDGFRLIAERSGEYQGQTPPQWCGDDGKWVDVWLKKTSPAACRVGVWKKNFREPLYAIALFDEYAQKKKDGSPAFMWSKMPALMLSKVAESLALRRAFPNDLSGLYTPDEMGQADNEAQEAQKVGNNGWHEAKKIDQSRNDVVLHRHDAEILGTGNDASTSDYIPSGTSSGSGHYSSPSDFAGQLPTTGYTIGFGKYKGKKLTDIDGHDLLSYYNYLNKQITDSGKPASAKLEELLTQIEQHLHL